MTFCACETKSHRLLEPLSPCFCCFVEFFISSHLLSQSLFTLATRVGPSLQFWSWVLCRELMTAACATFADNMRSCCCTPLVGGGIFVLFLRQYVTQRQCDNYAGAYSTNSDEPKMASGTLMLPMHGHSDAELVYLWRVYSRDLVSRG